LVKLLRLLEFEHDALPYGSLALGDVLAESLAGGGSAKTAINARKTGKDLA